MALTAAMETALDGAAVTLFVAVKIELPGATIRLCDGAGMVSIGGELFTGIDDTYGVLAGLDAVTDGIDSEAPRCRISLHPPSPLAGAAFLADDVQGAAVTLWEGVVDPVTGIVVDGADTFFVGEIDLANMTIPAGGLVVELDCNSVFERFFDDNEGARLSPAWHKSFWPGELGLDMITGVTRKLPWGVGGGGTGFKGQTHSDFIWFHKPFTGGHFGNQDNNGLF